MSVVGLGMSRIRSNGAYMGYDLCFKGYFDNIHPYEDAFFVRHNDSSLDYKTVFDTCNKYDIDSDMLLNNSLTPEEVMYLILYSMTVSNRYHSLNRILDNNKHGNARYYLARVERAIVNYLPKASADVTEHTRIQLRHLCETYEILSILGGCDKPRTLEDLFRHFDFTWLGDDIKNTYNAFNRFFKRSNLPSFEFIATFVKLG